MSRRTPPDTHPKEFSRLQNEPREFALPKADPMQILHPFAGSVLQYTEQLADPDRYRPDHCPQCQVEHPLTAHGFYTRTLLDTAFDGSSACAATCAMPAGAPCRCCPSSS